MLIHNRISVLIFKRRDDVNTYFSSEAIEAVKDNHWYDTPKRLMLQTEKIRQKQKNLTLLTSVLPYNLVRNTRNNLLLLQKEMSTVPHHRRPLLQIQLSQLQPPHRRAPPTGYTPTTRITTQFLQLIP